MVSLKKALARLRIRMVNAWWMVRDGQFRLFIKSIVQALTPRRDVIRSGSGAHRSLLAGSNPGMSERVGSSEVQVAVVESRFHNSCKVFPPSHRPTRSIMLSEDVTRLDVEPLSAGILRIRETIALADELDG